MNILLIGGNGFIGSHISDWLIRHNHQVRVLDSYSEKYRKQSEYIDYRLIDINFGPGVLEALEGIDIVFHLMSTTVPSTSNADILNDINQNLSSSINILNLLVKVKIKKIVYFSSGGAIYGSPLIDNIPETYETNPISSYGIVKLAMEKYLHLFELNYGIRPIIIRPSNPYGPRQGHIAVQGVIATFLLKLLRNEELTVWGNGNIIRDFIYIEDLANLSCLLSFKQTSGIYNIGSSTGHSINEIIEIIRKVTHKRIKVNYLPSRLYDVNRVILDTSKLQKIIQQPALISIEEGITRTWEWINNEFKYLL